MHVRTNNWIAAQSRFCGHLTSIRLLFIHTALAVIIIIYIDNITFTYVTRLTEVAH